MLIEKLTVKLTVKTNSLITRQWTWQEILIRL